MKDYTAEDKAQRERLERNSPRGQRADMVSMVNGLAKGRTAREAPGLLIYGGLLQSNRAAQANDALERLHPESTLRREAGGQAEPVEPEYLGVEKMRTLAATKVRASRFF